MADHVVPEPIPDPGLLFRRVHRHFFNADTGIVSSAAFDGPEMSVNWEKYATAEATAMLDASGGTVAVVALVAGFCRTVEQTVIHDPIQEGPGVSSNLSHALVCGRKSRPIKQKLRDASDLVWKA